MSLEFWTIFVLASIPIHFAPGPNNLLSLTHGAQAGYKSGHVGSLGRFPAFVVFFAISGVGLGTALAASATFFIVLKWLGGAYLVWLGIQLLRSTAPSVSAQQAGQCPTLHICLKREFLAAAINPKAILFASAFYAQFIDPQTANYASQFVQMVAVSFTLEFLIAGVYAAAGASLMRVTRSTDVLKWLLRVSGVSIAIAGIMLIFSRRPQVT